MMATLEDLRTALHDADADQAYPDPSETVAGVQRRVTQHRRRLVGVAAAFVAVLATGLGLATTGAAHRILAPSDDGSDGVSTVTHDPHLGGPGATTLSITHWQLNPDHSLTLSYRLRAGASDFLEAYCERTASTVPDLVVTDGSNTTHLICVGANWPGPRQQVWLLGPPRSTATSGQVTITASGANGIGEATIGIFEETPVAVGGPRPLRPASLDTAPRTSWAQLRDTGNVFAPRPGQDNSPVTIRGSLESDLLVSLIVRGPGTLTATANGQALHFECLKDVDDILGCRAGGHLGWVVTASGYGEPAHVYFDLEDLPGVRPGMPLTITVTPSGFAGDDWRVATLKNVPDASGATQGVWSRER